MTLKRVWCDKRNTFFKNLVISPNFGTKSAKKSNFPMGEFRGIFLSILIYVVFHFHQKSDCYQKCLGSTSFYVNFYCTSFIWRHLGVKMNSKWLFNTTIVFPVLNIINFKYSHVQDDLPLVSMCSIWCHSEIRHFRYLLMSISGYRVQCVWVFLHFCVD